MSIFHDPAVLMQKARQQLQERTLTTPETKKKEEIVKSMKKSAGDFEKRYPGCGKEVMYATATKQAKKVAEDIEQLDEIELSYYKAGESPKEKQRAKEKNPYERTSTGGIKINAQNVKTAAKRAGRKLLDKYTHNLGTIRIGEEVDSQIVNHLIENGYATTEENAQRIFENMSESWLESIMEREHDEPGESDDRPDVKAHNRAVKYRPRPRRPRTEDNPRYGTPMDRSGKFKY